MSSEQQDFSHVDTVGFSFEPCDQVPDDLVCAICWESFSNQDGMEEGKRPRKLHPCKHIYHLDCIIEWLIQGNFTCPTCRCALPHRPSLLSNDSSANVREPNTTYTQGTIIRRALRTNPAHTGPSRVPTQAQRERYILANAILAQAFLELERRRANIANQPPRNTANDIARINGLTELANRFHEIPHTAGNSSGLDLIDPLDPRRAVTGSRITAHNKIIAGERLVLTGSSDIVHGNLNHVMGSGCIVIGNNCTVVGDGNIAEGENIVMIGENNLWRPRVG